MAPRARSHIEANKRGGVLFVRIFFFLFVLVGLAVGYFLFRQVPEMLASRQWPTTDCTVISSSVGAHHDDGTTYSIDIRYSYTVEGTRYESDRYRLMKSSSSGYESKRAVVDRYPPGKTFKCYYNPGQPERAVIKPGLSPELWFGLIPVLFVIFGIGGMIGVGRMKSDSGARSAGPAQRPSSAAAPGAPDYNEWRRERSLKASSSPGARLGCCLVAAVILSVILVIIYFDNFRSGRLDFSMLFNPFVLIDLVLLGVGLPYFYMASLNPRPSIVLSPGAPALGERATIKWSFTGSTGRLNALRLTLVGREECEYRRGTRTIQDRAVFYEAVVFEGRTGLTLGQGSADFQVPGNLMHSWPLEDIPVPEFKKGEPAGAASRTPRPEAAPRLHNRIIWELKLHGEIGLWPDIKEDYRIIILPRVKEGT